MTTAFTPVNPDFAQRIQRSFERQGFMTHLGAELTLVEPGLVEIQVPFRAELAQQHGFFHAGVVGTLADNCGGYAAFSLMPADASVLSVEYKMNFLAPAAGERLVSVGRVLKPGKSLTICRCEVQVIKDGTPKLCAASQMTIMTMAGQTDRPPA